MEISELNANSVDPDQTPRLAASDLGLHCLPMSVFYGTPGIDELIYYRNWYRNAIAQGQPTHSCRKLQIRSALYTVLFCQDAGSNRVNVYIPGGGGGGSTQTRIFTPFSKGLLLQEQIDSFET